ncbi:MAG: hypothetical protein K5850_00685 [Bacteroidales bacterium]|nr:hypothetical protein [Bacteroidales bacterium]
MAIQKHHFARRHFELFLEHPELDPLMEYLNSRKAVIITHPHKPSAANDKLIDTNPLVTATLNKSAIR